MSYPQRMKPVRKRLDHATHFAGRFGAIYFVTICCDRRGVNQLCRGATAPMICETARRYHATHRWYLRLLLLMPDHLHILVGIEGEDSLSGIIRDFKRATSRFAGVCWQRNFFDHRIRRDESLREKEDYIRENPIRAGLIAPGEKWRYVLALEDLSDAK
jgi:putative transposase